MKQFGDWRNISDVLKAGKIAVGLIKKYMKDIEKRYVETFKNFNTILKQCDLVACYDNTVEFRRFAIFRKGKIVRLSKVIPDWFRNNVIY